jgi:hypothetical protein
MTSGGAYNNLELKEGEEEGGEVDDEIRILDTCNYFYKYNIRLI